MIQANELRIGNWVEIYDAPNIYKIENGFCQVEAMTIHYMQYKDDIKLCGIPITEDILLNCGFVREHYMYHLLLNKADDIILKKELRLDIDGDEWFADIVEYYDDDEVGEYSINIAKVKHLHQLQNLYFALTQKELTIKL